MQRRNCGIPLESIILMIIVVVVNCQVVTLQSTFIDSECKFYKVVLLSRPYEE